MRFGNLTAVLATGFLAMSCSKPAPDKVAGKVEETPALQKDSSPKWDPWAVSNPHWAKSAPPFNVLGNVYSVGTAGLSCFLITTDDGHILIDGGLPGYENIIIDNIAELGFDIKDVHYLLNSHAHFDHSGGLARLKELSGAEMVASEGDRSALEGGFYLGSENNKRFSAPPVKVDQIINDGETLSLGDVKLTANITPGHSRGCTSWTMTLVESGVAYEALFL